MGDWAQFWQIVLYTALGLFTVLSVWVIVFGYRDIKLMFAELRRQGAVKRTVEDLRRPGDDPDA